jgi:hypothetical protein
MISLFEVLQIATIVRPAQRKRISYAMRPPPTNLVAEIVLVHMVVVFQRQCPLVIRLTPYCLVFGMFDRGRTKMRGIARAGLSAARARLRTEPSKVFYVTDARSSLS